MNRTSVSIFFALALALAACGSDAPLGATAAKDVNLADTPLSRVPQASLLRAGDSFTLAAYEAGQVRWGRVTVDGVLAEQAGFALPVSPLQGGPAPVFAATKRTRPGDQLIAIVLTTSATAGAYDLVAVVQTVDEIRAAAPVVLATLPAGTDPKTVQLAAGAATSGNLGFVAWGTRVPGVTVKYLLLPADSITTAEPAKVFDDTTPGSVPAWDCLKTTNGSTGLGFSVVYPDSENRQGDSDFEASEIDEGGNLNRMPYQLTVAVTNCRIVGSPSADGSYVMAFETATAIDAATYLPIRSFDSGPAVGGTVDTIDPLMSDATFDGPLNKPIPLWVSSPGGDISIGLQRSGPPRVVRFNYNGAPHGSTLTLRSDHGVTGPAASWVGPDAVYVTYTDEVRGGDGGAGVRRYFMRIDSPSSLP